MGVGGGGGVTLQSVSNPNSPDFLSCLIETRCPNTAGVFIYDFCIIPDPLCSPALGARRTPRSGFSQLSPRLDQDFYFFFRA